MINVPAYTLRESFAQLARIVEKKNTLPVLSYVHVAAYPDRLVLSATDLELGLVLEIPCQTDPIPDGTPWDPSLELFSCCVPCQRVKDLLRAVKKPSKKTPSSSVQLEMLDSRTIKLTIAGSSSTIYTLPAADFPAIPALPLGSELGSLIDCSGLAAACLDAVNAITQDETRFVVPGTLLVADSIIATDGHRLILRRGAGGPYPQVLLPRKTIAAIGRLDPQYMDRDDKHVYLSGVSSAGPWYLISRVLDGTFPQYEKVIPRLHPLRIPLDDTTRPALLAAVRSLMPMSNERTHQIRLRMNGELELSCVSPDAGESRATLPIALQGIVRDQDGKTIDVCDAVGTTITASFNALYLEDVLSLPVSELMLKDGDTQCCFNGPGINYVIMPMRA